MTAKLRRAWSVEDLKKGPDGKRLEDDRRHALDAIVLAATTEAMLQALTRAAQEAERRGEPRGFDFANIPCSAGFRESVVAVLANVFVSRPERRRARGEAHAATIKQVREVNGAPVVFERKAVEKLTPADLENIPVPGPYGRVGNPGKLRDETVATLRRWIEAGRPKDDPPRSPKGDMIRKVRVATKDKVAVLVRGGTADRGEMARVDVQGCSTLFIWRPRAGESGMQHLGSLVSGQKPNSSNWLLSVRRSICSASPENAVRIGIFSNTVTERTCSNV